MNIKNERIALIPAYEPDEKLLTLLRELKDNNFNIVVVNDGSSPEADPIFRAASKFAAVLTHSENQGKGAAIKTGLTYISELHAIPYTVVTVDADGQHRVSDAIKVCDMADANPESLILGSRRFTGKVPLRSKVGNTITRLVYRISSGLKVYDTQTGLRAFSSMLVPRLISVPGSRYEYEMNVLMSFAKDQVPIREEWIETVYIDDNSSSHFNTIKDSYRIYKEIILFSGSSFVSFLVDYALYSLFMVTSKSLVFSNISARAISASLNYTMNRKMVFRSSSPIAKSALQYATLAIFILILNTALLKVLTGLGIGAYVGKIITEIIMFAFGYMIQHAFIFKQKEAK